MSTTVKPDADELKEATDAFDHPDAPQTTPLTGSQGRYKVPFSFWTFRWFKLIKEKVKALCLNFSL